MGQGQQRREAIRAWWRSTGLELLPLARTLHGYTRSKAKADFRAATNVALLDFPQSMAYALLAGLPVQAGIIGSAVSSIVGPLFGGSRFVVLGPTNATAVLVLSTFLTLGYEPARAVVALPALLLLVGVFLTLGALFQVASLVQYVSRAVMVGYITAAGLLIIINQIKNVLGLDVERAGTLAQSVLYLLRGVTGVHWPSAAIGALTLATYWILRRFFPRSPFVALTLVLASAGAFALHELGLPVPRLASISLGSLHWQFPEIEIRDFASLANGAMAIASLCLLEAASVGKTLAARAGETVNLNQQLLGMGVAAYGNALAGGMPPSGSPTRSALNYRSGAQTPVASIFSGTLVGLGLVILGPLIGFVPQASLATLVILVGISVISRKDIRVMLRATRGDAAVFLITLSAGVFLALDTAIYVGAAASILLFVRQASRPDLSEIIFDEQGNIRQREGLQQVHAERPRIAIVHVEGDLFFGASDVFLDQMRRLVDYPDTRVIILRLRNARNLDATSALAIGDLVRFARERGDYILLSGVRPAVDEVMRNSGLLDIIGAENRFLHEPENQTMSTRNALKRAQDLLGDTRPEITIVSREVTPKATSDTD